ncbi:MAG: OadG family protein [Lentisphaeria bacterium]
MEIIINACIISALGISFVFLFLIIQVWVTNIVAKFAGKYSYLLPEPEKSHKRSTAKAAPAVLKTDDSELIAVISAALHAHTAK